MQHRQWVVLIALLLLAGCQDVTVVKGGIDLCVALAPPTIAPAVLQTVARMCGPGK